MLLDVLRPEHLCMRRRTGEGARTPLHLPLLTGQGTHTPGQHSPSLPPSPKQERASNSLPVSFAPHPPFRRSRADQTASREMGRERRRGGGEGGGSISSFFFPPPHSITGGGEEDRKLAAYPEKASDADALPHIHALGREGEREGRGDGCGRKRGECGSWAERNSSFVFRFVRTHRRFYQSAPRRIEGR